MLKKSIDTFKVIVKQLAIAFFFASFFILIVNLLFKNNIDFGLAVLDAMTTVKKTGETANIVFDSETKRLVRYPNFGDVWAKIKIPSINVEIKVYQGDTLALLKYGAGHYTGSYFPGEGGTVVIDAHNSQEHFGRLPKLEIGDKIIIEANYGTYTYEVTSGEVMTASKLEKNLPIQSEKEMLLLYTCYPPAGVPGFKNERYVIYAKLVGD